MSIVPQQVPLQRVKSAPIKCIRGSNMMSTQQKQTNFEEIFGDYCSIIIGTLNVGALYRVPGFQIAALRFVTNLR